jgi:chemotaxis protein methyltransferase CheR
MTPDDFAYLAEFLRRRSGLLLPSHKSHLIEGRLAPVARRFGFRNINSLVRELRHARYPLARAVTEAMTTNESSFFRDRAGFDLFRNIVLPELVAARAGEKRLRIWSAACAAGQEAYSIAMLLDDAKLVAQGWSVDLIATDLSSDSVARAELGVYSQYEVQRGLSPEGLRKHFTQEGSNWRVNDSLRRMISFHPFNLLDSYGWLGDVDVVFCRNVLMYLDHKTKMSVLDKLADTLSPDGTLLLGHLETTVGLTTAFVPAHAPGLYVRPRAQLLPLFNAAS